MRLFLYGTLLQADLRARRGGTPTLRRAGTPAVLHGWRRVQLRETRWPTLRRWRHGAVCGVLVHIGADAFGRLAVWEGPAYRLRRMVVHIPGSSAPAYCWIATGSRQASLARRRTGRGGHSRRTA